MLQARVAVTGVVALMLLAACGGGAVELFDADPTQIYPADVELESGDEVKFVVPGGASSWAVDPPEVGGVIDESGFYRAPDAEGTYAVLASVPANDGTPSGRTRQATVRVRWSGKKTTRVSPKIAALTVGATLAFKASSWHAPDARFNWEVEEGVVGGTITADGLYTAPSTPGTYHVIARRYGLPTESAIATVTVTAPAPAAESPTGGGAPEVEEVVLTPPDEPPAAPTPEPTLTPTPEPVLPPTPEPTLPSEPPAPPTAEPTLPPAPEPTPLPPASQPTPSPAPAPVPTWAQVAADMSKPNEAYIFGVPLYWGMQSGALIDNGNKVPMWNGKYYSHTNAWGEINVASNDGVTSLNTATNTRVHVRNMELWFLIGTTFANATWHRVQSTDVPPGCAYPANYDGGCVAGDRRVESEGFSVKIELGRNYHFYPQPRDLVPNPAQVQGVLSIFQARLIKDNPAGVDDRANAAYIANSGHDYWPDAMTTLSQILAKGMPHHDGGRSKAKFVKPYWRFFAYSTLTADQLAAKPPPINLEGVSP